jgi:hypothetical protein
MFTYHSNTAYTCHVDDLPDVLDGKYVAEQNRAMYVEKMGNHANEYATANYFGGFQYRADAKVLLQGWPEGAAIVERLRAGIEVPAPVSIRRKHCWTNDGELNVDRALRGDWDIAYRGTTKNPRVASPVVTLACQYGGNWKLTPQQLQWQAIAACVVVDALESAGYGVDYWAVHVSEARSSVVVTGIQVKTAGDPLRSDVVCGLLGHAGGYRAFGHMLDLSARIAVPDNLGTPQPVSLTAMERIGLTPDAIMTDSYSEVAAVANITKALATITGERP